MSSRLNHDFFNRHVLEVAPELLGKRLVVGEQEGIITETEAYGGFDDPASHAFKGPTKRSSVMFDRAGLSYVYFIYGMYYCFNIVTDKEGVGSAVLVRGVLLSKPAKLNLNGPGKLCKHMGINLAHNALDLITHEFIYLKNEANVDFISTPRIGITKAQDKLWRFVMAGNTAGNC
jgi:DNA-3-methyladenine glycosylase